MIDLFDVIPRRRRHPIFFDEEFVLAANDEVSHDELQNWSESRVLSDENIGKVFGVAVKSSRDGILFYPSETSGR